MGRHPANIRIQEAIDLLEKYGEEITPASVMANVQIGWRDWPPDEALNEALQRRILEQLRTRGYVIVDAHTRVRKDFWQSNKAELQEQLEVKLQSSRFDRNRIKADKATIALLEAKEDELGYEVYPGLFAEEIDRIYRMHGIVPPSHD